MSPLRGGPSLELDDLLELTFDAVFVRRLGDQVITYWNAGCEELYGWPADEAVGRRVDELLQTRYPDPPEVIARSAGPNEASSAG